MTRNYKKLSVVSGLTIDDILNMDEKVFESLLQDDLGDARKIVGRLVSAGNKRLRAFERANTTSPAYRAVMESGGKFSIAGRNAQGVSLEFQRAREFFKMKTSSVTKYRKQKEEVRAKLKTLGVDISQKDYDKVFDVFNKLKKSNANAVRVDSDKILKKIRNIVVKQKDKLTADEMAAKMYNQVNKIYEKYKKIEESADVSSFFEIK